MTTAQSWTQQPTSYQGNIQDWSRQPIKPLKGSIDARNLSQGRPYQGSINAGQPGNVPNRANPYKYYNLPDNYYGTQKRPRANQEPTRKPTPKQNRVAPAAKSPKPPPIIKQPEVRQKTPLKKPTAPAPIRSQKPPPKKPPPPPAPIRSQKTPPKPKSRENKRSVKISPFPPSSPEPAPRPVQIRNPDPIRSRQKPEPIFPSILPVTLEEFVNREPTWRYPPDQPRGNVLIPVVNSALLPTKSGFTRYRRSPDNFFDDRDDYHDSLTRSFTNVPGYTAVGSILRSMDMCHQ